MKKFIEESLKSFRRFQTKVTMAMILSLLLMVGLSDTLIYHHILRLHFEALRERLMIIAQISTMTIDPDVLAAVPLNREGANTPEFNIVAGQLNKIKKANPLIKYIYIMIRTEKKGTWQFWVDPQPDSGANGRTSYPG